MAKPYSKLDSTRHAAKEVKQKAKPKPIPKMSEKKKAELEDRKTWTVSQFKKASKEIKKGNKEAFDKPKKTPLTEIKKDLDVIYSCTVRMSPADKDGYTNCVTCSKIDHWSKLQNGHFIKRSLAASLIFVRMNTHPQCLRCNILLEGNRIPYVRFMHEKYGSDAIWKIEFEGSKKSNLGSFEYQIMLHDYIQKFLVQCTRLNHTPTKAQQKIVDKWQK